MAATGSGRTMTLVSAAVLLLGIVLMAIGRRRGQDVTA